MIESKLIDELYQIHPNVLNDVRYVIDIAKLHIEHVHEASIKLNSIKDLTLYSDDMIKHISNIQLVQNSSIIEASTNLENTDTLKDFIDNYYSDQNIKFATFRWTLLSKLSILILKIGNTYP